MEQAIANVGIYLSGDQMCLIVSVIRIQKDWWASNSTVCLWSCEISARQFGHQLYLTIAAWYSAGLF